MSDAMLAWRFKVSAALGLLDAARINGIFAQMLAWIGLGLGLGFGMALPHAAWWQAIAVPVSGLSAVAALWLTTRVAIDRQLFAALAHLAEALDLSISSASPASPAPSAPAAASRLLGGLDEALLELGWISPAKANRPLDARVQGVKNLLRQTIVLLAVEALVLILISMGRFM